MEERYDRNYRRLLRYYREREFLGFFFRRNAVSPKGDYTINTLENVINKFKEENLNYNLRPDAEYFLILNFHEMIALPLLIDRDSEPGFNDRLQDAIAHDASLILNWAREQTYEREISGHSIVQSLSSNWGGLKTTEFKLWNRHSD